MAKNHDFGYHTYFFEGNKVKVCIFKFECLQAICKSKLAAFKYYVNKKLHKSHWTGATEFGTKKMEEFERTWSAFER